MDLFLKIVGGVVLVVGSLVVLGGLFFFWRIRVALKAIKGAIPTPSTISLTEDQDPAWTRSDAVAQALGALAALGHVRGPAYTVPEMPGVCVLSLHHPASGTYGCYYHHPTAGHWVDLVATLADGTELTVGNPPMGSEMDTRPGTRKLMLPKRSVTEAHATFLEQLAGAAVKPSRPEDFVADFQAAYAKDMAWRNAKGGTSEEEFLRVAENHGQKLTADELKEAFKQAKRQEIERWSEEIIEAFGRTTTLSVAEWKKYDDRMFILREDFHAHAFLDYLCCQIDLGNENVVRYMAALDGGVSLAGLLARIAADTGHTFTKLGEVTEPQPTAIYGILLPPESGA
jgi:hypothetical protein